MTSIYQVRTLTISSGERLPLLVNALDGQPLYWPTIYSLTELRARNRASNTISHSLRSILFFHLFLDLRQIDLYARIQAGQLLALSEIEDLVRLSRLPVERVTAMTPLNSGETQKFRVVSLAEKRRVRLPTDHSIEIDPTSVGNRLRYIRDFIGWLATERLLRLGTNAESKTQLEVSIKRVISAIDARLPAPKTAGSFGQREGLEPEVATRLFQVIDPESQDNPWKNRHARERNALAIQWMYHLGLRRGELLGVRISDIDFQKGTVLIARRADDPHDPRRYQPNAKTKAREIPLLDSLQRITSDYIMDARASIPGARKHDFLLVSGDTGAPWSVVSLAKAFQVLREKCKDLPRDLSAHVLRHTWNENFSIAMDKEKTGEETEKKIRSYLMGWSETSGTAATYTRRHIRNKAREVSLDIQKKMQAGKKP